MSFVPLAAALLTALALAPAVAHAAGSDVLVLEHGHVHVRHLATPAPADPVHPTAADSAAALAAWTHRTAGGATAAAARPTVTSALKGLLARGAIDQPTYASYAKTYADAQAALKKLSGRRYDELAAVLGNTVSLAAAGQLTSTRAPLAFLTLERNRQWWTTGRLLAYGERVTFGTSQIQWQSYPGQGIQVQWLGTFGTANGMTPGKPLTPERAATSKLKALLDEITPLAVPRGGGIAWECMFRFDGGVPPWVSSITQGTAVQVYTRAAARLADPTYLTVAKRALGIFQTRPPTGLRDTTAAGAYYRMYSFTPLHILNGFIQSLNGLHDYAAASGDGTAEALFRAGEAEARVEVPQFDTGAWSLYQPGQESDLGYHQLLTSFLQSLCDRLTDDRTAATTAGEDAAALPSPAVYCTTAAHFRLYETQPPKLTARALTGARVGQAAGVRITLSKISSVTLTVRRAGAVVSQRTLTVGRGPHTLTWGPVAKAGAVTITVTAKDLNGHLVSVGTTQTAAK